MEKENLCYLPAVELASRIRRKDLSPVEVVRTVLERIEALEPKLNAFATLCADQAMEEARRAEAALVRGTAEGELFGVPVTIKDLTATRGIKTERGSHIMKGAVPEFDAPFVTRLRHAGAITLGKTTTS